MSTSHTRPLPARVPADVPAPSHGYQFRYPAANYHGIPERMETRTVLVTSVRDTRRDTLDPSTAELNPTLRRGRWLVTGQDLDKGQERSFYFESMRDLREIDPGEQPLRSGSSQFAVIDRRRVVFASKTLLESIAFRAGSQRGLLCKLLCPSDANSDLDSQNTRETQPQRDRNAQCSALRKRRSTN